MYYLYKRKGKPNDESSSTAGRTASTAPVTLQSSSHHRRWQHQRQQRPHPISEEGNISSTSFDVPEGLDSSTPQSNVHSQRHPSSGSSRRPTPAFEDTESKQKGAKDDQVVRRLLRRRGLEENDFTEDVMQPRRPNRVNCQLCQRDIATSDSQQRIVCSSSREKHVFCRRCVVNYVSVWVDGEANYELRQSRHGAGRGLYTLPCMSPSCQSGCYPEASMQPLLSQSLFMSFRLKLAKVRAYRSQARALGKATMGGSSQPPPQRRNQPEEEDLNSQHPSLGPLSNKSKPDFDRSQRNRQQSQQDHFFQRQQQKLLEEEQRLQQQHLSRQQQLDHNQLLQQQQQQQLNVQDTRQHHIHQYSQQVQSPHQDTQPLALPLPPALRRSSTASTGAASQKTQKTSKSVRFSIQGNEEQDDMSTGSSTSSLTTRFPMPTDHRQADKEDSHHLHHCHQIRHPQHGEQHQDELQTQPWTQQQPLGVHTTTCQCCYEDFSSQASPVIVCGRPQPTGESHRFCAKCVRLYVEEWVFGAATYTLRPGPNDKKGQTALVLPCLHGDCVEGGFPDDQLSLSLSPRSVEQYKAKMTPLRILKEDDEERLVQMAIRMSLEQDELKKRVSRLHEEQQSLTREGIGSPASPPSILRYGPPTAVDVPTTNLSTTSSMTSFTTVFGHSRSLPDMPTGSMSMKNLSAPDERAEKVAITKRPWAAEQHTQSCERSVHEVEEAMTLAKVRTCPNCQNKFLKDEDFCNKLKCPSCKTAICYICRNVVPTQGYEHFCIHKQGGCGACLGLHCPLWTQADDDNRRDTAEMRARGLDEANRIWEESLLQQTEIRVDVDSLLRHPSQRGH